MSTLYYLSATLFIWADLVWILSPIEKVNMEKEFINLTKKFKGKTWDEYSNELKSALRSKIWSIWFLLWMFIGLFTFQWAGFLAMLILNILIVSPLSKLLRFSNSYIILQWVNSLIGFTFGIFVIINHYHLKINLTEFFMSLLKQ